MNEAQARAVVLLQSFESGAETPLWTEDDRRWATRAARQDEGGADFERFVAARAQHAMQRLLPRDAGARRWLQRRGGGAGVLSAAFGLALVAGALADHLGAPSRVDLLAPWVWALVAWNLAVYAWLLLPHGGGGLRGRLVARWLEGGSDGARLWVRAAAPVAGHRATVLLHAAAAGLALGLVAGMYLRGLVLDYRAGWQSTFLDPGAVQALLGVLLAPARALTGLPLPDVAPLRVGPGQAASASAAPWIHLYAATLALFVIVPRALLALVAAARAWRLARRFPLAMEGAYFDRLRAQQGQGAMAVQVWPHGQAPTPQATLGLRTLLTAAFGDEVALRFAPAVAPGDEERVQPAPGAWQLLLCDLASTPEAEAQGRLLAALAGRPRLVVCDEAGFARRFAHLPERVAERRAAWQRWAGEQGVPLVAVDLEGHDFAAAAQALQRAPAR